jgi:hypothetical protein
MNSRAVLMYGIDVGLFVFATVCIVTGIIKFPELTSYIASTGLVLPFNRISYAHDWSGIIMTILILFHIGLNWKWMIRMTRNLFKKTKNNDS